MEIDGYKYIGFDKPNENGFVGYWQHLDNDKKIYKKGHTNDANRELHFFDGETGPSMIIEVDINR